MADGGAVLPHYPDRAQRDGVLASVTRLLLARAQVLTSRSAKVEQFPLGHDELVTWLHGHLMGARRELLAVTLGTYTDLAAFLPSHHLNKEFRDKGLKMLSIYDYAATASTPFMVRFLAETDEVPYLFGYGPVQLKVIDRREVIMEGPSDDGARALLCASDHGLVEAALAYVNAVRATAVPARSFSRGLALTSRQHAVAGLLATGQTDEKIADVLGVSVRTVRSEIAQLFKVLGATSRFAAGLRYSQMVPGQDHD